MYAGSMSSLCELGITLQVSNFKFGTPPGPYAVIMPLREWMNNDPLILSTRPVTLNPRTRHTQP